MKQNQFLSLDQLLPHKGEMILLREVRAFKENEIECATDLTASSLFDIGDGRVSSSACLEIMAQAIAVHAGLAAHERGENVKVGLLVGTRDCQIFTPYFVKGEEITIIARRSWQEGGVAKCECSIYHKQASKLLAQASLTVFMPQNFAEMTVGHEGST